MVDMTEKHEDEHASKKKKGTKAAVPDTHDELDDVIEDSGRKGRRESLVAGPRSGGEGPALLIGGTGAFDTRCLFSTIRNVSGSRMIFGFLPPHGRELAANEEYTVFGNILDAISHYNGDRVTSRRHILAFESAIHRGDLIIVNTPAPIFEDVANGQVRMIRTSGGTLGVVAPCWANPGSMVNDMSGGNPYDG